MSKKELVVKIIIDDSLITPVGLDAVRIHGLLTCAADEVVGYLETCIFNKGKLEKLQYNNGLNYPTSYQYGSWKLKGYDD